MNAALQYLQLIAGPGNPIVKITMGMDHNFAFAEFRTLEVRVCRPRENFSSCISRCLLVGTREYQMDRYGF